MDYDVVILGNGPAGLATALALRQGAPGLSVAVLAPPSAPGWHVGESVPPGVEPLLHRLGVHAGFLAQGHRPAFGTAAAWGRAVPVAHEFFFHPRNRGWQLDRARFDRLLDDAACAAGATRIEGRFAKVAQQAASPRRPWLVEARTPSGACLLSARFVVDATGRSARFAACLGVRTHVSDALVGAIRFFRAAPRDDRCAVLVEACEDGWWYSAPLPGHGFVAAMMTDAAIARTRGLAESEAWERALHAAPYSRGRLSELLRSATQTNADPMPRLVSARSQRLDRCTGAGWLAVGDAASAVDPLTSQGIVRALRFGLVASYAIRNALDGVPAGLSRYEALVQTDFQRYLTDRCEAYGQEARWTHQPFWASRRPPRARMSENIRRYS